MKLRLIGVLAVLALVVASCASATPQASGPTEGIQVHGDWTIDIYNEDGTLDEHIEFTNALTPTGAQVLAEALTPLYMVSNWRIEVANAEDPTALGTDPCGQAPTSEPCNGIASVELPGNGELILISTFTAEQDGNIGWVKTQAVRCIPNQATGCSDVDFTATTVADENGASFNVDAGQQIDVEVTLSFTSG